jgi:tRNA pseudouridine38-40 synthase
MARYQIILSYDGTEFHGFQRQGDDRTVQLEVENALRRMGWEGRSILAAGRTDTGVHASGQVISFDMEWSHSTETMAKALNAHLPQDIGVSRVWKINHSFHPRFDALWRTYRYNIYFQPFRDPLRDRYAWRLWPEPGWELPQAPAKVFLGTHDFQAFGSPMKSGGNTVRTIKDSFWVENCDAWTYEVTANAFLRHMVRRVVYVQILVAMQKMTLDELQESIMMGAATPPGIAPPNGLTLESVVYEDGITGIIESEFVEK